VFILPREALKSRDAFYEALRDAGVKDEKLLYYLDREVRGSSSLDPLMRDPNLENIECSLASTLAENEGAERATLEHVRAVLSQLEPSITSEDIMTLNGDEK